MLAQLYCCTTEAMLCGIKVHTVTRGSKEALGDVPCGRWSLGLQPKEVEFKYQLSPPRLPSCV